MVSSMPAPPGIKAHVAGTTVLNAAPAGAQPYRDDERKTGNDLHGDREAPM
jgi:hypothetical protein